MQVNIYTPSKEVFNQFIRLSNDESWDYIWKDIQNTESQECESLFSIFVISTQFANSIWLMELVNSLKEQGLHDQSMAFILFDREKVKTQDLLILIEDLKNRLSQTIISPKIIPASIAANEALMSNDLRYMYYDDESEDYHTLEQIQDGNLIQQHNFEKFIGKQAIQSILSNWTNTSEFMMFNKGDLKHIVTFNLSRVLLKHIRELPNSRVSEIFNEMEFDRIASDSSIIGLKGIDSDHKVEPSLVDSTNRILYITYNHISNKLNRGFNFNESLYKKSTLPPSHLMNDSELVIFDYKGYPIPKKNITNWKDAIYQECGLTKIITTVEVL